MTDTDTLREEILLIHKDIGGCCSSLQLLAALNGPVRIQSRGFAVEAPQLLEVIIEGWPISGE